MCGIFAIYDQENNKNVAKLTYFALYSLQHRGQESAGITVSNGKEMKTHKNMGLVSQIFDEKKLSKLTGNLALGHVRYSTTGSSNIENAQPFETIWNDKEKIQIAHNGNLVNFDRICSHLGITIPTNNSDTELIALLLKKLKDPSLETTIQKIIQKITGAYSIVIMSKEKIIAFRDPYGIRPLCLGRLGSSYVLASESCAFDIIGAQYIREVEPGEIITISKTGLSSTMLPSTTNRAMCVFEYIYFARPDSNIYGKNLYCTRVNMGRNLAREQPVKADMVISVPDSGTPAAIGYSKESGIPLDEGLIKNRYVGRTFISPTQEMRELGVRIKLNPISKIFEGKRIVIVDDSIVRGTTSRKIVNLVRKAGAREVHVRVSSPPILFPCFYGIDTATKSELIAANMSLEKIRQHLNADSLGYLSIRGLTQAINLPSKDLDLACLNGEYPIKIPEEIQKLKLIFK